MSGRLTLSWVNKDEALMPDGNGGYEWVPRDDPRVTEVRLLHPAEQVGEVAGGFEDNLLIQGDSYDALHALARTPEFARKYRSKVKLVYIDPPFNTGQAFEHYDDALEHSIWLGMIRERLLLIRDLLAPDGSLWVHLDDTEMAYCRVLLDEIFGRRSFIGTIAWETDQGRRNDTDISVVQDYILIYTPDRSAWKNVRNLLPRTAGQEKRYRNPDNDPRGPWLQGADSTARSGSDAMRYPVNLPSGRTVYPPSGVYWRFSKENFESALAEGRVYFGADGDGMPIVKRYLSEVQAGVVPRTWWPASEVGSNMGAKRDHLRKMFPNIAAFSTPKPEQLLKRIIHIASKPGDIVLDCFAGSGTTAAVAHKMGRRWVAIEISQKTIDTFTKPRLEKVINDQDPGGITEETIEEFEGNLPEGIEPGQARRAAAVLRKVFDSDIIDQFEAVDPSAVESIAKILRAMDRSKRRVVRHWSGGGGFQVMRVGPSLYERVGQRVLLADWATGNEFAQAVAAQLGFWYKPDGPFAGVKGRTRLGVVDGIADDVVMKSIVSYLDESERVTVVAKGAVPGAEQFLRELSPGSRLMKVPSDLVRRGRVIR